MTDLEINIALAKAMGWDALDKENDDFRVYDAHHYGGTWRKFDYRDPVIFVAICKRWRLVVNFDGWVSHSTGIEVTGNWCRECIEKAAALTVIDAVKRGVK